MKLSTRLSLAWQVLRGQPLLKARPSRVQLTQWPTYANQVPQRTLSDLPAYIEDGFELNPIIYAAVMYKVRALIVAPLKAYLGTPEQPLAAPPNHPLAQLLRRPNPWQSALEFRSLITVFLNLAGNAFIWFDRPRPGALPSKMHLLWPDRVRIVPDPATNELLGFWYIPEGAGVSDGVPILPEDMAHLKLPNANDRKLQGMGHGMSPIKPLAQSGDTDNAVTRFLIHFFTNGTVLGGVLKFKVGLGPGDADRIKATWREAHGGVDNWADILVLDTDGEYQRVAPTFEEMGFEAIDERNETRILGPLGVAPILIGARSGLIHGTYSNYEQARRATWEDTIDPELSLIEDELAYYLQTEDGAFPMHDRSRVPALRRDIGPLTTAFADLVAAGVPPKIAAETVGLKLADYPGSDRSRQTSVTVDAPPTDEPPDEAPAPPQRLEDAEDEGRAARSYGPVTSHTSATGGHRRVFKQYDPEAMYLKIDSLAVQHEDRYRDAAVAQFEADLDHLLALVGETEKAARRKKAGINWRDLEQPVKEYLEGQGADAWRDTFVPLIEATMLESAEEWAAALGIQFNVRNLRGEVWFQDYVLKFAQPINQTTSDAIHQLIDQALAEGWSNKEMTDRLGLLFKQWMNGTLSAEDFQWLKDRLPPHRRELIARTETTRAANAGAFHHFREWDVAAKRWHATLDGRQRPSHETANGQVRPLDEPFDVGQSQLMYPGDSSLGADISEIADCRCGVLPEV